MSWVRLEQTAMCPHYRGGWTGVWDSLVAAVMHRSRETIAAPVTVSFYYKPIDGTELSVEIKAAIGSSNFQGVQLESTPGSSFREENDNAVS